MPTPLSLHVRSVSGIPTFPMPSSSTIAGLIIFINSKQFPRGVYDFIDLQSFTEPNVFTHHNFGERALTIILNQNSDFATTLNSNWLQNDKSQSSF
jgi:hypothetical protein